MRHGLQSMDSDSFPCYLIKKTYVNMKCSLLSVLKRREEL